MVDSKGLKIDGTPMGSGINGIINFFKVQPKITGGFGRGELSGGHDKAAKQIHLNGGSSSIRYGIDKKIVLFILVGYRPLGGISRKVG